MTSMQYLPVGLVSVFIIGVLGDSGGGMDGLGLEGLEEGFLFDDLNNGTDVDYDTGSGEFAREPFRDIAEFGVCVTDEDCAVVTRERGADYRCFQYMCYPWGSGVGGGQAVFRSCKRRSECQELREEEGGDGCTDRVGWAVNGGPLAL